MRKMSLLCPFWLAMVVLLIFGINRALAADLKVDKSKWPKSVFIAGGTTGGIYQLISGAFLKVLDDLGVSATTGITGGPVPNVILVSEQKGHFSFTTMAAFSECWEGKGVTKGKKYQNIRILVPLFVSYLQFAVMPNKGIQTVQDLNGKVVGLGPRGASGDLLGRAYLEVAGIKPSRIVSASYSDTHNMMNDGLVDALGADAAERHPALMEVLTTMKGKVIGPDPKDIPKFLEKNSALVPGTIPAETYKGHPAIPSVKNWSVFFTNNQWPEDFMYETTKKIFEKKDTLVITHSALSQISYEAATELVFPLHMGAYKYYQDRGVKMKPEARPPEMK